MKAVKRYEKALGWMLCVFLIVYPFIMGFHVEEPTGIAREYFVKKSGYASDIFQYYKEVVLIVFSLILSMLLLTGAALAAVMEEKFPGRYRVDKKTALLLGGFLILTSVSCVLSEYPEYAFMGLFLDYEGWLAILGYGALFTAAYVLLGSEGGMRTAAIGVRMLSFLLIAGACVECIAGPVFNIEGVAKALTPERYEHLLENTFLDYHGMLAGTFANPGYFGGVCAMLLPILYGTALTGEKRLFAVCDAVLAGGLALCIVLSGSSGALYAAVLALAAETAVIVWKRRKSARYWCIFVLLAAAAAGFLLLGNTQLMKENGAAERLGDSVVNSQYTAGETVFPLDRIELTDGVVTITSKDSTLSVSVREDGGEFGIEDVRFTDGDGQELAVAVGSPGKKPEGEYQNVSVSVMGQILSLELGYQDPLEFYLKDGKLYYIDFNGSLLSEIPQPETPWLEPVYPLFTGRGYIWASSLPLLKECLFLGKGVGTFPFYFPQSEAAGMLNVHGSADYCIEIAHSWYVQTAVNGGVLSLLCMLGLFALHLWRGGKFYLAKKAGGEAEGKRDAGEKSFCALAVFFGLLAFQTAGIVNNSTVAAAPIFWILFGCSMGYLAKKSGGKHKGNEKGVE